MTPRTVGPKPDGRCQKYRCVARRVELEAALATVKELEVARDTNAALNSANAACMGWKHRHDAQAATARTAVVQRTCSDATAKRVTEQVTQLTEKVAALSAQMSVLKSDLSSDIGKRVARANVAELNRIHEFSCFCFRFTSASLRFKRVSSNLTRWMECSDIQDEQRQVDFLAEVN